MRAQSTPIELAKGAVTLVSNVKCCVHIAKRGRDCWYMLVPLLELRQLTSPKIKRPRSSGLRVTTGVLPTLEMGSNTGLLDEAAVKKIPDQMHEMMRQVTLARVLTDI